MSKTPDVYHGVRMAYLGRRLELASSWVNRASSNTIDIPPSLVAHLITDAMTHICNERLPWWRV